MFKASVLSLHQVFTLKIIYYTNVTLISKLVNYIKNFLLIYRYLFYIYSNFFNNIFIIVLNPYINK